MPWLPYPTALNGYPAQGQGQGSQGQPSATGYLNDPRVPESVRNQLAAAQQAQQQLQNIGPHSSGAASGLQALGSFMAGRSEADANQQAAPYSPSPSSQPSPSLLGQLLRNGNSAPGDPTQLVGAAPGTDGGSGSGLSGILGRKSDRRLKSDVVRVGTLACGLPLYAYRLEGSPLFEVGCMADEVALVRPAATWFDPDDGFARVDYGRLIDG